MRARLDRVVEGVVVAAVLILVALGFAAIGLRYAFGGRYALYWAEETIRYGFIWVVWLVAPLALRRRAFLGVDLAVAPLPAPARRVVTAAGLALVAALLAGYVWYGAMMARLNWAQLSTALEIPMTWAYLALPVGALGLLAEVLVELRGVWRGRDLDPTRR